MTIRANKNIHSKHNKKKKVNREAILIFSRQLKGYMHYATASANQKSSRIMCYILLYPFLRPQFNMSNYFWIYFFDFFLSRFAQKSSTRVVLVPLKPWARVILVRISIVLNRMAPSPQTRQLASARKCRISALTRQIVMLTHGFLKDGATKITTNVCAQSIVGSAMMHQSLPLPVTRLYKATIRSTVKSAASLVATFQVAKMNLKVE